MAKTRRLRITFSIRALLCVVLVCAIFFAQFGHSLLDFHREQVVKQLVQRLGGDIKLSREGRIEKVNLSASPITRRDLHELSRFSGLKVLNLRASEVTDQMLGELRRSHLVRLDLSDTAVTDAGLDELQNHPTLGYARVDRTCVSNLRYRSLLSSLNALEQKYVDARLQSRVYAELRQLCANVEVLVESADCSLELNMYAASPDEVVDALKLCDGFGEKLTVWLRASKLDDRCIACLRAIRVRRLKVTGALSEELRRELENEGCFDELVVFEELR